MEYTDLNKMNNSTTELPLSNQNGQIIHFMPSTIKTAPVVQKNVQPKKYFFSPGQTVLNENQNINGVYKIISGNVKVSIPSPFVRGRHKGFFITEKILGTNSLIGVEAALGLEPQQRPQFTATSSCEVEFIPESDLGFHQLNEIQKNLILQSYSDIQQSRSDRAYQYLASIRQKIAHKLLELADAYGVEVNNEVLIKLKLTRSEMAQLAGTINESLSRHLGDFEKEEIIRLEGRQIFIKDRNKLLEVVQQAD